MTLTEFLALVLFGILAFRIAMYAFLRIHETWFFFNFMRNYQPEKKRAGVAMYPNREAVPFMRVLHFESLIYKKNKHIHKALQVIYNTSSACPNYIESIALCWKDQALVDRNGNVQGWHVDMSKTGLVGSMQQCNSNRMVFQHIPVTQLQDFSFSPELEIETFGSLAFTLQGPHVEQYEGHLCLVLKGYKMEMDLRQFMIPDKDFEIPTFKFFADGLEARDPNN